MSAAGSQSRSYFRAVRPHPRRGACKYNCCTMHRNTFCCVDNCTDKRAHPQGRQSASVQSAPPDASSCPPRLKATLSTEARWAASLLKSCAEPRSQTCRAPALVPVATVEPSGDTAVADTPCAWPCKRRTQEALRRSHRRALRSTVDAERTRLPFGCHATVSTSP
jgi:hypothetical protein